MRFLNRGITLLLSFKVPSLCTTPPNDKAVCEAGIDDDEEMLELKT